MQPQRDQLHVASQFQPVFRELGIDAESVFSHPLIKPWRTLPDRENCTLDAMLTDGRLIRFHVKRYATTHRTQSPADAEVTGHRLLLERAIPTLDIIAWGRLEDGRTFTILDDLSGYTAADKLVERGLDFEQILQPTAELAANLHDAELHHRDLYLCHFFARISHGGVDLRLIDTARVRILPRFLRHRWIIKDLAQFNYSTLALPVTDEQREKWFAVYARCRGINPDSLRAPILRKVRWIERHDRQRRRRSPDRNISIPQPS